MMTEIVLAILIVAVVGVIAAADRRRRAAVDRANQMGLLDSITGLPSAEFFQTHLTNSLARARRQDSNVAILFIDLDRFRAINGDLGHEFGNQLLAAVANRLRASARQDETFARIGGDEFVLLLEQVVDATAVARVAQRLLDSLTSPFEVAGQTTHVSATIGISLGDATDDGVDLLRNADLAMQRAKRHGRACYEIFDATTDSEARKQLALEVDLREALARGEFALHYLPEVSLHDGKTTGMEALIYWQHPSHGPIPPTVFIPIAEQTGLIVPIGRWVLEQACRATKRLQAKHGVDSAWRIAVNVSGRQLERGQLLVDEVAEVLEVTQLSADSLTLEITESVLMQESEVIVTTIQSLRGLGVDVAIDDFGTGYSSLSYLRYLPASSLKIDRSFVSNIGTPVDEAIITSVMHLASAMGASVVAEGIETREQASRLSELGCERGQGFYYSRPVSELSISAMLRETAKVVEPVSA